MSSNRYQLWMRLRFHHPGHALHEGQASFGWRILDVRSPDYQAKRLEAVEYGYVLAGSSDDCSDIPSMMQRPGQQIEQALAVLKAAQRYGLEPVGNYMGEAMMSNDYGDWLEFDDVVKAIQILEGQQ